MVEENFTFFYENSSSLIRCRFALMLGYYADNLFVRSPDHFTQMIQFLIKGLSMEGEEKALSLQCADALKSIISDQDMVVRLEVFINKLFPYLTQMVAAMKLPSFFDILTSIIKSYATAIDTSVIRLLEALVARVEAETKTLRAKGERLNLTINLCWNVIRTICDEDSFFPEYLDAIENALLPAFNYLVDPMHVSFDDDMIMTIMSLIRTRQDVSDNMAKIFPHLQKYYEKHKGVFGGLLQTLNYYMLYGKARFTADKSWIEIVLKMAHSSLFSTYPPIETNNTEGAILCQMILQTIGGGALDPYIPPFLLEVLKRLESGPSSDFLTRQLYNVFLCAVCNNGPLTLSAVAAQGKLDLLIDNIIKDSRQYKLAYDRKVLVVGFANILVQDSLPPSLAKRQPQLLDVIVATLQTESAEETKKLLKVDKKAIAIEDNGGSGDSSESDKEEETMMATEEKKPRSGDSDEESDDELSRDPLEAVSESSCTISLG